MQALLPLLLIVAFYVVVVVPQRRRQKAQHALVAAIEPGSHVMTTAGVYGTVRGIDGDIAELEIAPGVVIRIAKQALARQIVDPLSSTTVEDPHPPEVGA